MLVHVVVFWLKKELSLDERVLFEEEVRSLEKIPSVDRLYVGSPAHTPKRPVIEDSYDFCLTVVLEDLNAHDAYQQDPLHLEFIRKCSHMWERVRIFDAE